MVFFYAYMPETNDCLRKVQTRSESCRGGAELAGAFGDLQVRGGSLLVVKMVLGDIAVNNYMCMEKVTHTWEYGLHTMLWRRWSCKTCTCGWTTSCGRPCRYSQPGISVITGGGAGDRTLFRYPCHLTLADYPAYLGAGRQHPVFHRGV